LMSVIFIFAGCAASIAAGVGAYYLIEKPLLAACRTLATMVRRAPPIAAHRTI